MKNLLQKLHVLFVSPTNSKTLAVLALLVVISAIPLTVFISQRQQEIRQRASETNTDTKTINILVLKYFPLDASGTKLDPLITGTNDDLNLIRARVDDNDKRRIQVLTESSKYHGYKNPSATSAFNLTVIDDKEFLKALPLSVNEIPWNPGIYRPDYRNVLTSDIDVCDYVDNKGVKQIWLWGYHHGKIEPVESDMSMGLVSKAFWNFSNYGDVSNSELIDDLPICNNTYILFNYNFTRAEGETLENHGHHIEALMNFIDPMLWYKFINPHGLGGNTVNHCGWTHSPPNVTDEKQYHWSSEIIMKSDCEDWKPEGGEVKDISCHTWSGSNCDDDGGEKFKKWWIQNIPGLNNNIPYQGKLLRNWLDFYSDFDSAIAMGKSLVVDSSLITPTPTLTPTPTNAVTSTPILTPTLTLSPTLTPTQSVTLTPTPTAGACSQANGPCGFGIAGQPLGTCCTGLTCEAFTDGGICKAPGSGDTILELELNLKGIGSNIGENSTPMNTQKEITIEVFNASDQKVGNSRTGSLTYNNTTKTFKGGINAGALTAGAYKIKIKAGKYLRKLVEGIFEIPNPSDTSLGIVLPKTTLIVGDITGDNKINVQDYNQWRSCLNKKVEGSCINTDLNDDGLNDTEANLKLGTQDILPDFKLLIASFQTKEGD